MKDKNIIEISVDRLDDSLARLKEDSIHSHRLNLYDKEKSDEERVITTLSYNKLVKDGYASVVNYPSIDGSISYDKYEISYDGLLFLENTNRIIYKNKPYRYSIAIERYKRIAREAKNIVMIANAILIVYFSWLTISVNSSNSDKSDRFDNIDKNINILFNENELLKNELLELKNDSFITN